MTYSDYLDVEKWEVLDTKVCHFYNDDETPFNAVCVKIGTYTEYKTTITGVVATHNDIIRWISNGEYAALRKNSGQIIF